MWVILLSMVSLIVSAPATDFTTTNDTDFTSPTWNSTDVGSKVYNDITTTTLPQNPHSVFRPTVDPMDMDYDLEELYGPTVEPVDFNLQDLNKPTVEPMDSNYSGPSFIHTIPVFNFTMLSFTTNMGTYNSVMPIIQFPTPTFNFTKPNLRYTRPKCNFTIPQFNYDQPSFNFSKPIFNFPVPLKFFNFDNLTNHRQVYKAPFWNETDYN